MPDEREDAPGSPEHFEMSSEGNFNAYRCEKKRWVHFGALCEKWSKSHSSVWLYRNASAPLLA